VFEIDCEGDHFSLRRSFNGVIIIQNSTKSITTTLFRTRKDKKESLRTTKYRKALRRKKLA
jgi:hypothetical protein